MDRFKYSNAMMWIIRGLVVAALTGGFAYMFGGNPATEPCGTEGHPTPCGNRVPAVTPSTTPDPAVWGTPTTEEAVPSTKRTCFWNANGDLICFGG